MTALAGDEVGSRAIDDGQWARVPSRCCRQLSLWSGNALNGFEGRISYVASGERLGLSAHNAIGDRASVFQCTYAWDRG